MEKMHQENFKQQNKIKTKSKLYTLLLLIQIGSESHRFDFYNIKIDMHSIPTHIIYTDQMIPTSTNTMTNFRLNKFNRLSRKPIG